MKQIHAEGKYDRGKCRLRRTALALTLITLTGCLRFTAGPAGLFRLSAEAEETVIVSPENEDVLPEEAPEADISDEGDDSEPVPVDMMEDDEVEEEILEGRLLQFGDSGDDVLALQTRLRALHYYTGNLSGNFREGTQQAVRAFQKDYDLEETGIADIQTQAVLYAAQYRPLRFGSSGEDVKTLQTKLMALGYYKGKISGNYLEATREAVRKLQERNGLAVDGEADPELQAFLYSGYAAGMNDAAPTATPAPELNAYLVNEDENAEAVPMADQVTPFSKKLKNGSSGKLVKQLQERLNLLGYYDGPISGNFLKNTTRAVKALQTQNGLKATGIVDEETWNVIFNEAYPVLPGATPKPTPSPSPVPFAITVDVANQVTTVYGRDDEGNYSVVVRQMLCSTGLKATPSDVGDWVLNGRHATWCYFPKWGSYARYWTRINSSIAFHSVIYHSVSNTDMKTSSYSKLGSRASHGCIRLTVEDAKWIFDNVGAGTVVSIVEGMPPDPELRDALKLPPLNKKSQTPVETPVPTPEPDYASMEVPELGKKTLQEKSENEAVYWVQRRLAELGYYTGKCSGKFLAGTKKAVKAFQRASGVYPSGQVNQNTIDLLAQAMPDPTPTPGPELIPEPES